MDSNQELCMYVDSFCNPIEHREKDGKFFVPLSCVSEVKKIFKFTYDTNMQDYYENPQDYVVEEINNNLKPKARGVMKKKYKVKFNLINKNIANKEVYMYVDRFYRSIKDYWVDQDDEVWIPVDRVDGVKPIYKQKSDCDDQN